MSTPLTWLCPCGRRVPARMPTCHCGLDRAAAITSPRAAAAASPAGTRGPWFVRGRRGLALAAVVVLYLGSRACVRYNASEAAWVVGREQLGRFWEPRFAQGFAYRHHGACFWRHYSTGWGTAGTSAFDEHAYVTCMANEARAEMGMRPMILPRPAPTRVPAATAAPTAEPIATEAAAAEPAEAGPQATVPAVVAETLVAQADGPIFIGEAKVSGFRREPQLSAQVTFMAIGNAAALGRATLCSYTVRCGDELLVSGAQAHSCLTVEGARGAGSLSIALSGSAPAGASCTLEFSLSDGQLPRSNSVTVPLS